MTQSPEALTDCSIPIRFLLSQRRRTVYCDRSIFRMLSHNEVRMGFLSNDVVWGRDSCGSSVSFTPLFGQTACRRTHCLTTCVKKDLIILEALHVLDHVRRARGVQDEEKILSWWSLKETRLTYRRGQHTRFRGFAATLKSQTTLIHGIVVQISNTVISYTNILDRGIMLAVVNVIARSQTLVHPPGNRHSGGGGQEKPVHL